MKYFYLTLFMTVLLSRTVFGQTANNPTTPGVAPSTPKPTVTATTTATAAPQTPAKPKAATPVNTTAPKPSPKPATPPAPRVMPKAWGDRSGPYVIGHRFVTDHYTGWGWIKKPDSNGHFDGDWDEDDVLWTTIEETPGVIMIPSRYTSDLKGDNNKEYKLYGQFTSYKCYDPNYDIYTPVFRLKGFEVLNINQELDLSLPRSKNHYRTNPLARERGNDYGY